jgi:ADP-ribose pyrophosphatase YjhB (NUDIX family)
MDHQVKENMLSLLKQHGDTLLTRENPIAHMTASSVIINEERTKMLMIHHKIYDTWTWQGGHTDGEEDLLNVALKEAEEDTGLKSF